MCNVGDANLIPGPERSPGGGHDSPLQYSHLENPMDRGAWQAIRKSQKESDTTEHAHKLIKSLKCKLAQGSLDTTVDRDDPWPQGSCSLVRRQSLKQEQHSVITA